MNKSNRRNFIGRGAALATAAAVAAAPASAQTKPTKKVWWANGKKPDKTPMFSPVISYGNLVFVSGAGAHFEGDIKAHTKAVLDQIEQQLQSAGSSMSKALKCNVYLSDIKNFEAMNEVFLGRFGEEPPVRTTIAASALPGKNAVIEIDVIAYI